MDLADLPPTVDTVVLDAGGVLLMPDARKLRALCRPFDVDPDEETCRRAHYRCMREVDVLGVADWPKVDAVLAAELGIGEADAPNFIASIERLYLFEAWIPIAGVAEALRALQAGGYQLAVVSNATGTIEQQLATHRICSVSGEDARVAVVVDSHVVGVEKPDPAIFAFALAALGGVEPDRCLYVGDTVHFDVNGARAAGLHPVHVDPYRFCPYDDHPHIDSVTSLPEVLVRR